MINAFGNALAEDAEGNERKSTGESRDKGRISDAATRAKLATDILFAPHVPFVYRLLVRIVRHDPNFTLKTNMSPPTIPATSVETAVSSDTRCTASMLFRILRV